MSQAASGRHERAGTHKAKLLRHNSKDGIVYGIRKITIFGGRLAVSLTK